MCNCFLFTETLFRWFTFILRRLNKKKITVNEILTKFIVTSINSNLTLYYVGFIERKLQTGDFKTDVCVFKTNSRNEIFIIEPKTYLCEKRLLEEIKLLLISCNVGVTGASCYRGKLSQDRFLPYFPESISASSMTENYNY